LRPSSTRTTSPMSLTTASSSARAPMCSRLPALNALNHGLELGERLPELAEQGLRQTEPDERLLRRRGLGVHRPGRGDEGAIRLAGGELAKPADQLGPFPRRQHFPDPDQVGQQLRPDPGAKPAPAEGGTSRGNQPFALLSGAPSQGAPDGGHRLARAMKQGPRSVREPRRRVRSCHASSGGRQGLGAELAS